MDGMSDTNKQYCCCHKSSETCTARMRLHGALRSYFKFDDFRDGQLEAMLPIMHGKDVFVRMATGSGKSICMFLPPLAISEHAIGVVISPLNTLMDQQVSIIQNIGISAVRVVQGSTNIHDVTSGKYRFVFMSPELVISHRWRDIFASSHMKKHLVIIAVDEAHCIPEWGANFRTAFSSIGGLRALCNAPIMALTATASSDTQSFIIGSLSMSEPLVISQSLNRPNIFFSASGIKSLDKDLSGLASCLSSSRSPGDMPKTIVFAPTKNTVCRLYRMLSEHASKKKFVGMFHASMEASTKALCVTDFKSGKTRCLVSTIAFGMGMDIPDIELVIMYGAPSSVNQLHQLCGRAGRGGDEARAHIFYSTRKGCKIDPAVQQICVDTQNCRRQKMLEAVGSRERAKGNTCCCDSCGIAGLSSRLQFESFPPVTKVGRKRRTVEHKNITEDTVKKLKQSLQLEREKYLECHPAFRIFGPDSVCSDSLIDHICSQAKFVKVEDDLQLFTLWPELRPLFFRIIIDVLSELPSAKKSHIIR